MATTDYQRLCFDTKGRECDVCGSEEDVEVHHIDGDRSNNSLSNLVPLCSMHHGQVHGRPDSVTDERVLELIEELGVYASGGVYNVTCRMEAGLLNEVDEAAEARQVSRAQYVRGAVKARLDGDESEGVQSIQQELELKKLENEMLSEQVDELLELLRHSLSG